MSPDLRDQRVRLQDDLADVTPEDRLTQATPGPPCPSASPSQRREVDPPERGRTVSDYLVRPLGPDTWDAFGALAERHNGVWAAAGAPISTRRLTFGPRSRVAEIGPGLARPPRNWSLMCASSACRTCIVGRRSRERCSLVSSATSGPCKWGGSPRGLREDPSECLSSTRFH
jgi:hypothetical protein